MINKNDVLEFIKKQSLAVISTVTPDHKSESAVMAYSVKDDLTLIMSTEPNTRKYQNIQNNQYVSVVIGGLKDDPTLQIDGIAKILNTLEETEAKTFALAQHPELKDYLSTTCKFFTISPVWLRYSDFSQNPPEIVEFNEF